MLVSAQEPPLTHVQNLYLEIRAIARQAEDIPVHELRRHHRLALHRSLDRQNQVTQPRGLFELLRLGHTAHSCAQILCELPRLPAQKENRPVDEPPVGVIADEAAARCGAASHGVLQTWTSLALVAPED